MYLCGHTFHKVYGDNSLINPHNTVKLIDTNIQCKFLSFWLCNVSLGLNRWQTWWTFDKETKMCWGKTSELFWWIKHFSICAATVQFQGCVGSPVTLQFYSVRSVPEHNSPLILQLIWRWLWRWLLWRSAVWSQPQSKCPWMKYRSSNCSPRQQSPHCGDCVFICPREQEAPQIMQF